MHHKKEKFKTNYLISHVNQLSREVCKVEIKANERKKIICRNENEK